MSRPVYSCRLCDTEFHELLEVIDIFSAEGQQLKVAAKILFVLSIVISEDDPAPKFICRACFGQVEVNVRFTHKSRLTHYKHMKNNINLPNNHGYKEEVGMLMAMPIHSLFYRHFSSIEDLQGMYDALIQFMKNTAVRNETAENRLGSYDQILQRNKTLSSGTNGVLNTCTSLGKMNRPLKTWSVKPLINTKKKLHNVLTKRSQSSVRITKPNISKHIKFNHMRPYQNKAIDETAEVICLDDDDSNDDTVEVQPVEKNVHKSLNNFNNIKINQRDIPTTNVLNISNVLNFQRKIVPITDGPLSNSKTEEMTVTPDMPIPDIEIGLVNPVEPVYYNSYDPPPVVKPTIRSPLVTPETGFHFLFSTGPTVDLTLLDNQQQKKRGPTKGKRKNKSLENQMVPPKKIYKPFIVPASSEITNKMMQPPTSKTLTREQKTRKKSLLVPASSETDEMMQQSTSKTLERELPIKTLPRGRPKRASTVASANSDIKKFGHKLGKHAYGEWKVEMFRIPVPLYYTCSICGKTFPSHESRRKHEKKHTLPTKFIKNKSDQMVSALENLTSTEQQEFLGYFNLVKQMSLNVSPMDRLATRNKLLKALKRIGDVTGSYSCHICQYNTCRLFILWAHMSSCHLPMYSEKKCGAFCFVCNRFLGKRSKLLKHLDNCTVNQVEDETKTTENLSCDYCNENISTVEHLEKHLWKHATS